MRSQLRRIAVASAIALTATGFASARDQIRIVGSSTVHPFTSYVAEEFGATTDHPTPIVESTGSGGGHKLFAAGVGENHPDITNSSRRIKASELELNRANGVDEVIELMIGYDGIAVAFSKEQPPMNLTLKTLALAVAAEVPRAGRLIPNPYRRWSEIDPRLPDREIRIYGPPTTSGTRDAFDEMVLAAATAGIEGYPEGGTTAVREDGVYIESGENDNLIVQRLVQDRDAIGIFGYSFLAENTDRLQAASIEGIRPEPAAIADGTYPIARSLFLYVKKAHLETVPGLAAFIDLYLSERMIGDSGYLRRIGLIPLTAERREEVRRVWKERRPVRLEMLESAKK